SCVPTYRSDRNDAWRNQSVDTGSTEDLRRDGRSSCGPAATRGSRPEGIAMSHPLPAWAEQMRDLFRSGSVAQFLIHGNIFDVVPTDDTAGRRLLSLETYLESGMVEGDYVGLQYDAGRGRRVFKAGEE